MSGLFADQPVPLERMLGSVRRELGLRRRVYPRLVEGRRMKQEEADEEIATMVALEELLEKLVAHRVTVARLNEVFGCE